MTFPLLHELPATLMPSQAIRAFADWPGLLVFASAGTDRHLSRWSFLTADPLRTWEIPAGQPTADPFAELRQLWSQWRVPPVADRPPFQGGFAGLLSYELGTCWERLPVAAEDEFEFPLMAIGWYDWTLAWDHATGRVFLIVLGDPSLDESPRLRGALSRKQQILTQIGTSKFADSTAIVPPSPRHPGGKQFPISGPGELTSNFSREGYLAGVAAVIDYIRAGDIFQANLTQRLLAPARRSPVALFESLLQKNPAPFAGLFQWDDWAIISASPERFLRLSQGHLETRPIKGTRRRSQRPEADLFTRDELRESQKDQAENIMIVDLLRNDLSRSCLPGSIRVPQLCRVETYATVQHLVSEVHGDLKPDLTPWDVLQASWPGGSITGAPKIRAMEILANLEPVVRGPYTGSLFYVGLDGSMDSNLLIRTFTQRGGWLQLGVGGGIVAASNPVAEYEETLHKAAGMLRALQ